MEEEASKAANEALNPPGHKGFWVSDEACRVIEEAKKPFIEKMEEARKKVVAEGKMTVEEANAIKGLTAEKRRAKRKAMKNLQKVLNREQMTRNKAVHEAIATKGLTAKQKQAKVAEATKHYEDRLKEIREMHVKWAGLTAEETEAIVPNVGDDIENEEQLEERDNAGKKDGDKDKDGEPVPRVVTDKGFPVTKEGLEKFFEINQELEKRDPDSHNMYIYNDFAGYGTIEVLENVVCTNAPITKRATSSGLLRASTRT